MFKPSLSRDKNEIKYSIRWSEYIEKETSDSELFSIIILFYRSHVHRVGKTSSTFIHNVPENW